MQPRTYLFLALDEIKEFSLFSVLENDEDVAARVNELKMFDNVWVVETAQDLDLPLHFLEHTLHFDSALVQNFDSDEVLGYFIDRH